MRRSLRRVAVTGTAAFLIAGIAGGCTADPEVSPPGGGLIGSDPVGAPGVQLVAFDSCESALRDLKNAALKHVGPYGLSGPASATLARAGGLALDSAATGAEQAAPQHSTTNVHETAADEPDLVKTDGKRIVSLTWGNVLRVVDVASRKMTATIDLDGLDFTGLFLHGDRALVISSARMGYPTRQRRESPMPYRERVSLQQVDLTGRGKVLDTLTVDAAYVDARATDGTARVVVRSDPRLEFTPPTSQRSEGAATRRNKEIIRESTISDWLPRYTRGKAGGQLVDCSRISHPKPTTGSSLLTVLTLDLGGELGKGDPVSITAGGGTIYGTGDNLYVADDNTMLWREPGFDSTGPPRPPEQKTKVYQFDTSGDGPPKFLASGAVEGSLLNQYSMSEHDGHLRIATTTQRWNGKMEDRSESSVVVLKRQGEKLVEVGEVGGLGKGEQIYSVRFIGDLGYVVTFRQVDPLYRIDLSDPANPRVAGELKITGFSSYLHPIGDDRLFGVGQGATSQGRVTGLQMSLFDIGDAKPVRLDRLHITGGHSDAENDPHAFLYWPDRDLVVLQVRTYCTSICPEREPQPFASALVLRVGDDSVQRVGTVKHHDARGPDYAEISRSLIVGDTLWTFSGAGIQANSLDDLSREAFISFG
jgi:hypothetical protein